jgi:enoyl-CoA hydratase
VGRSGGFRIGLNEVEIGMALPRFAVALARHRLESRLLTQAGLLATTWDGDGAVTAGYLDETSDDPTAAAVEAATRFARFDRRAFAVTKRRLREPLLAELSTLAI